jgi:hypothetical protein
MLVVEYRFNGQKGWRIFYRMLKNFLQLQASVLKVIPVKDPKEPAIATAQQPAQPLPATTVLELSLRTAPTCHEAGGSMHSPKPSPAQCRHKL